MPFRDSESVIMADGCTEDKEGGRGDVETDFGRGSCFAHIGKASDRDFAGRLVGAREFSTQVRKRSPGQQCH